jgi:hypothetical protein
MLANGGSAGDESGIYSISARHSVCVNEIIIINCEGSNTNYSEIAAGSTFYWSFNTTFKEIAFFLATRYMHFLLSLLALFKQW